MRFWSKVPVGVRAAIIAIACALITGSCMVCSAVIGLYPEIRVTLKDLTSPRLDMRKVQLGLMARIRTELDGQAIVLFPTDCWQYVEPRSSRPSSVGPYELDEQLKASVDFLLLSSGPTVITDISLVLDDFSPESKVAAITEARIYPAAGGVDVPRVSLGTIDVGPWSQQVTVKEGLPHQLGFNDSSMFEAGLIFQESGQYDFHIEVEAQALGGREEISIVSDRLSLAWFFVDDLSSIEVLGYPTFERVGVERCPK
jgi:hypothetical protein